MSQLWSAMAALLLRFWPGRGVGNPSEVRTPRSPKICFSEYDFDVYVYNIIVFT